MMRAVVMREVVGQVDEEVNRDKSDYHDDSSSYTSKNQ